MANIKGKNNTVLDRISTIILVLSVVFSIYVFLSTEANIIKTEDGLFSKNSRINKEYQKEKGYTLVHSGKRIISTLKKYNLKMVEKNEIPRIVYFFSEERVNTSGFYDPTDETKNLIFINYEDFEEPFRTTYYSKSIAFYPLNYFFYKENSDKMFFPSLSDNIRLEITILHEYAHLLQHKINLYFPKYNYYMSKNPYRSSELSYDFYDVEKLEDLNHEQEADLFSSVIMCRYLSNNDKKIMESKHIKPYYDYIISRFRDYINH